MSNLNFLTVYDDHNKGIMLNLNKIVSLAFIGMDDKEKAEIHINLGMANMKSFKGEQAINVYEKLRKCQLKE